MPAQTQGATVAFYSEGDTFPPLRRQLLDGAGDPIDLSSATVTIRVAHSRYDFYYSPSTAIADWLSCTPDADQVTNKGYVDWTPPVGVLSPPGDYQFAYRVSFGGDTQMTIPPNTYLPMTIRPQPGGTS